MKHSMRLTRDTSTAEFVGVYRVDGKVDEAKSYYTDSKEDCIRTIRATFAKLSKREVLVGNIMPSHTVREGFFTIEIANNYFTDDSVIPKINNIDKDVDAEKFNEVAKKIVSGNFGKKTDCQY